MRYSHDVAHLEIFSPRDFIELVIDGFCIFDTGAGGTRFRVMIYSAMSRRYSRSHFLFFCAFSRVSPLNMPPYIEQISESAVYEAASIF